MDSIKVKPSCHNCYYHISDKDSCYLAHAGQLCNNYERGCFHCKESTVFNDVVEYEYEGDYYCKACMFDKLGIKHKDYLACQYFDSDDNYIGDSHDISVEDLILQNKNVKEFKEK